MMYEINDLVVYKQIGVCRVKDIGYKYDNKTLYYTLEPLYASETIYIPVDTNVYLRKVIGQEEANELLKKIPEIPPLTCQDKRFSAQKTFYTDAMKGHDSTVLIGILKGFMQKKSSLSKNKGTLSATEEQYRKMFENLVCQEIATSLDISLSQAKAYIK